MQDMLLPPDRWLVTILFTLIIVAGALLLAVYREVSIERMKQEFLRDVERRLQHGHSFDSPSSLRT